MKQSELRETVIESATDAGLTLGKIEFRVHGTLLFIDISSVKGRFIDSLDLPESSEWWAAVPSSDAEDLSENCNVRIAIIFEEGIEE